MCELVTNEKRVSSCPHLPLESPSKLHRYPVGIPQVFAYGSPSRLTQWPWKQGFYLLEQNLISLSATCKIIILAFIYLFFKSVQAWVRRKWEFPIKRNRKASLQSSLLSWFIFVDAPIFFFKEGYKWTKEGRREKTEWTWACRFVLQRIPWHPVSPPLLPIQCARLFSCAHHPLPSSLSVEAHLGSHKVRKPWKTRLGCHGHSECKFMRPSKIMKEAKDVPKYNSLLLFSFL